eukprot:766653-Hanusia_phi.AAC.6
MEEENSADGGGGGGKTRSEVPSVRNGSSCSWQKSSRWIRRLTAELRTGGGRSRAFWARSCSESSCAARGTRNPALGPLASWQEHLWLSQPSRRRRRLRRKGKKREEEEVEEERFGKHKGGEERGTPACSGAEAGSAAPSCTMEAPEG